VRHASIDSAAFSLFGMQEVDAAGFDDAVASAGDATSIENLLVALFCAARRLGTSFTAATGWHRLLQFEAAVAAAREKIAVSRI
jgi:hypothetical protein